ncbi:tripartite tricarboxylate transporter permease [Paracoccus sp. Z118]|uniref:tripartite tricarboxylate transporter permease n=1 Tax=Paracoccus sp. Z118 TaxID=2851017 RepID=UPI001C2C6700|nr:tripartite tricarboxylate transporter permease [Paracoccus sp. Z118]MBV0893243.1 tripartite tricarboxylate transporter permease [Paracoccus sp. Z118]
MIENILNGFALIFTMSGLIGIGTGILVGYVVGAMPGLTSSIGMALLIPFTFGMDPIAAIVMLVTIYMASDYGGAIPAILVNAPGQPASAVTAFDGFAMTQRGEAGKALNISIMASTVGALISIVFLVATAQAMASAALAFGPAEYFALALLGLSLIAVLGTSSTLKSLVGLVFGLAIITIGIDPISGATRFVFHFTLIDGIPFLPALIGLFALSEVFLMIEEGNRKPVQTRTKSALDMSLRHIWPFRMTILRSSVIGYFVGVIPGAGATIASLISYGISKRLSSTSESYGKGNPEGVAAAESANNASVSGALAPLLSLGIPGSASAAVLIGGLTIQGLQPGPMLFANNPEVPYSIFAALLVGLPVMVVIGFLGVPLWVRMTQVPRPIVATLVTSIAMLGAYASANSSFEMLVTAVFGVIGYLLRKADIHPAPIVLALVLGEMMEANLRRALITGNESITYLLTKPITAVLLLMAAIILLSPFFSRKPAT